MDFIGNQDLAVNEFENLVVHSGTTADRTALTPAVGQIFFDTDLQKLFVYQSTGWYNLTQPALPIPVGAIIMWDGAVPSGWALCDGTGGTPNLVDKFARCVVNNVTNPSLVVSGSDTHQHNLLTPHTHNASAGTTNGDPSANAGYGGGGGTAAACGHTHSFGGFALGTSAGGADPVSNIPVYYALKFIIKT